MFLLFSIVVYLSWLSFINHSISFTNNLLTLHLNTNEAILNNVGIQLPLTSIVFSVLTMDVNGYQIKTYFEKKKETHKDSLEIKQMMTEFVFWGRLYISLWVDIFKQHYVLQRAITLSWRTTSRMSYLTFTAGHIWR